MGFVQNEDIFRKAQGTGIDAHADFLLYEEGAYNLRHAISLHNMPLFRPLGGTSLAELTRHRRS